MATKNDRDREERPIHVSRADELLEQGEASHSRDGSVHAQDGSEQPRLDERGQNRGPEASPTLGGQSSDREIGQFSGEGQPARQKK